MLLKGGLRRPAIPAAGSSLRSHPCVAVSSAQVTDGMSGLASLQRL
jgi:hypothetical protein